MPRTAATLLGMVLVAVSIGVNAVRYPVVWEMVGPAAVSGTATEPKQPQPKAESPAPQQAKSPAPQPIKPIAVKPSPGVGDQVAVEHAPPVAPKPAAVDATPSNVVAKAEIAKPTESSTAKPAEMDGKTATPLVPVAPAGVPNLAANATNDGAGIRRLPPPGNDDAKIIAQILGQPFTGAIPIYPSTGLD